MLDIIDYDLSNTDNKSDPESGTIYLGNNFTKSRGTIRKKTRKNNSNYTKPKKRK